MKKTLLAALLAAISASALASNYYLVVPVPNRTATTGNILVTLNPNALPAGLAGRAYAGFDFNSVLQVLGDPNFTPSSVAWYVASGALPDGLTLSSSGKLSGTPTKAGASSFEVMALYKTKSGTQAYQVVVGEVKVGLASASLPAAVQGASYTYDLKPLVAVTGDPSFTTQKLTWAVAGGALPSGLHLNTDGTITGVATGEGTGMITVQASYLTGVGSQSYQVVVGAITVSLASVQLPVGQQGAAYSYDLKPKLSVAGDAAYAGAGVTWSVASGALPAGLTLGADGVISGTPTAESTGTPFTIQAAYKTKTGQQAYSVVVGAITVSLAGATLPAGTQGAAYTYDLKPKLAIAGDASFTGAGVTWSVVSGSLPAGLTLGANGVITGTPTAESVGAPFTIQAAYKTKTGQQAYAVVVGAITISLASAQLPNGQQGSVYSYDLKSKLAVAGDAGYSPSAVAWSVVSGTLPAGLTLGATGVISGTPTAEGTGTPFTIQATYKTKTGQQAYAVIVGAISVSLAAITAPAGVVGMPYSGVDLKPAVTIQGDGAYAGAGAGVTWSVSSGTLPAGLLLNASTGIVSGTPSAGTTTTVQVRADYKNKFATQAMTISMSQSVKQFTGYRAWSDGTYAASCNEYKNGKAGYAYQVATGDGIYRIDVDGAGALAPIDVVCDMTTDGGGWTVFQRRVSGAVDFYRTYAEYANGFGNTTEYWLGNDRLAVMTAAPHDLRFDMMRTTGETAYAQYTGFQISPASDGYRLVLGSFIGGTAGDSFTGHKGYQFTTYDKDQDTASDANCAVMFHGAWWYSACHSSNLNGGYLNGPHASYADGMEWYTWTGHYESLARTEMKVR